MEKIKTELISNTSEDESTIDEDINDFLKDLSADTIIDIKYQSGDDWDTALILYKVHPENNPLTPSEESQ